MKKLLFFIGAVLLMVAIWWLQKQKPSEFAQNRPERSPEISQIVSNANADTTYLNSNSPQLTEIVQKFTNTQSKEQRIQEALMEENNQSLDLYGIVLDQYNQPVSGAKIVGSILLNVSFVSSGGKEIYTESENQGRFEFLDIHGVKMGIRPQKDGYYFNPKLPLSRPADYVPDSTKPLVLKMWKLMGKQPLITSTMDYQIPADGTPTNLALIVENSDIHDSVTVTLLRFPIQVKRSGQKFDWHFQIVPNGSGLIVNDDNYPYWAPKDGYMPSFQTDTSSNDVHWRSTLTQNFYVKSSKGIFGYLQLTLYGALTPPRLKFDFSINPSGSQSLEPDLST